MTSVMADGRTEFRFYRPGAGSVKVVGSFDQWIGSNAMEPVGNGWWIAQLELEPGEHQFRYVADGNWYTDFAANGVEKNKYGWNSILIVNERPVDDRRMRIIGSEQNNTQAETLAA